MVQVINVDFNYFFFRKFFFEFWEENNILLNRLRFFWDILITIISSFAGKSEFLYSTNKFVRQFLSNILFFLNPYNFAIVPCKNSS